MNKMKYRIPALLISLFVGHAIAWAQADYTRQVGVSHEVKKEDAGVKIHIDIRLDSLRLKSQHALVLTPVLQSNDKQTEKTLRPVVVNGRVRQKIYSRSLALGASDGTDAYRVVRRKNGEPQSVVYMGTIPYEKWMRHATLYLREEVSGCAACELGSDDRLLGTILPLREIVPPRFTPAYVLPAVQEVKRREISCELFLNFHCDKSDIVPALGNNRSELDKLSRTIREVEAEKAYSITGFRVCGYASPEGSFSHNMALSERRSRSLAAYIQQMENRKPGMFRTTWGGEDWEGLQRAVEASELSTKAAVLNIIRTEPNPDARDAKIRAIDGGATYTRLLKDFYPGLRRSLCTVDFTVRKFTVDEARDMLRTGHPEMLSVREIYDAAMTYPEGSTERTEALLTAARTYSDDADAAANAGVALLMKGSYAEARTLLEKARRTPAVCNTLGIAYAELKDYAAAETCFKEAAEAGHEQAKANRSLIEKYIKETNENNY